MGEGGFESTGRAMMGEMTFNQIYGRNETTDLGAAVLLESPTTEMEVTDTPTGDNLLGNEQLDAPFGSLAKLHEYLQDNPEHDNITGGTSLYMSRPFRRLALSHSCSSDTLVT